MAYESRNRALYGVWIDEAIQRNDPNELKQVLQEAKKYCPPHIVPLYAAFIDRQLAAGVSREDLQQLLEQAKAVQQSDLSGAISKLEKHLGSSK